MLPGMARGNAGKYLEKGKLIKGLAGGYALGGCQMSPE
jgi:hypothetical protein